MKTEKLQIIERLISDSFKEIADHLFQQDVNSPHIKKIKDNISKIMDICHEVQDEIRLSDRTPPIQRVILEDSEKIKVLRIAYIMSRFDHPIMSIVLGRKVSQTGAFQHLEKITGVKLTTLRNMRDRFDPYVAQENSNRKGWHQVELLSDYKEIKTIYDRLDYDSLKREMMNILDSYKKA